MALTASYRMLQKNVGNGVIRANFHTWIPIGNTCLKANHEECQQIGDDQSGAQLRTMTAQKPQNKVGQQRLGTRFNVSKQ